MDLSANTDRRDFRLAASATPIAAPGITDFQTIDSPTNVSFLNPPMTIGTVLVEAPRSSIRQGEYFMARFLAHSGWKRASFLALTTEEAPAMRDIVTLRMLAEPQEAPQRMHPRERIGLKLTSRVRGGSSVHDDAPVQVTVVDASRGGVCVETTAQLSVGDILYLEGPQEPEAGADFEVLRADPALRNRYGGRFLQQEAGNALFEQLVEAARADRAARRQRPDQPRAAQGPDDDDPHRGMRHRD
jgi:PilZ domain-containing protein